MRADNEVRWPVPATGSAKLAGSSQAAYAGSRAAHSVSVTENQAVSRLRSF